MIPIFIWVTCGKQIKTWRGAVTAEAIETCYALPKKGGNRFAYWSKVTGMDLNGHAMVWVIEAPNP